MSILTPIELTGLLDSISDERATIPREFINNENFSADILVAANIRNKIHLLPTGFGSEVARHLRHIPVNPHNLTASELLRKSYVYSSAECRSAGDEMILNASDYSLFAFMSTVIKSAKRERDFSIDPKGTDATVESLFSNCVHVIHGERGVGKTFFLNYALTRCNEVLDKRNTIWVRLNFVYSSGFEEDLEYWMHAQAAKIILRYYDEQSEYDGKRTVAAIDHLFQWIEENSRFTISDKSRLRAALRSMEQVFSRTSEDEVLRPSLCDPEICRELYRYMRLNGWSFIFVLDGFDQLDINPEQVHRFDIVRAGVKRFISMRAAFGAAIVIVTRTNTFDDFRAYDPFKGIPETRKYKIADVDFGTVVRKRFDAIKEVVISRIPPHRRETADSLENTIERFLLADFYETSSLEANKKINSSNIRAKLQTLYLMFLNFANESTGKGYLIIEHMLLNGMRYPAVAYQYSEASKDELIPSAHEISHEARFLPLITRYPLPNNISTFALPKYPLKHLLLNLRILQFCVAGKDLQKNQEIFSFGELASILTKCFGYSMPIVVSAINELAAFDLLRIIRREGLPAISPSNGIMALPKAEYLLNECIYDVAYLNLCAMRTPLPQHYFSSRFIQYAYWGYGDHSAQNWLSVKIVNSLTLYGTMILMNRCEMRDFDSSIVEALPDRQKAIVRRAIQNGLWDLIPTVRGRMAVEIIQILNSGPKGWLPEETKQEIAERVRLVFHGWRANRQKT